MEGGGREWGGRGILTMPAATGVWPESPAGLLCPRTARTADSATHSSPTCSVCMNAMICAGPGPLPLVADRAFLHAVRAASPLHQSQKSDQLQSRLASKAHYFNLTAGGGEDSERQALVGGHVRSREVGWLRTGQHPTCEAAYVNRGQKVHEATVLEADWEDISHSSASTVSSW